VLTRSNPDVVDLDIDIRGERQPRHVNELIAWLADTQHGVVARYQLVTLGLSKSAIDGRVASKHLRLLHRGVYAVGHKALTAEARYVAAVLTFGRGTVLSHRSAADLWEIAPYAGATIDITPPRKGRRSRRGLVVHHGRLDPADATTRSAIPITTVARTFIDLAEIVDPTRLARALERAEKLNLLDMRAIDAARSRAHGHHGLARLTQALAGYVPDERTRSNWERDFIDFCAAHQLQPPQINTIICGYEVDAVWPSAKLIVELDSWTHHRTRASFERDRARDADLAVAGYRVIRITWRRLRDEPNKTAALLRTLVRQPGAPYSEPSRQTRAPSLT